MELAFVFVVVAPQEHANGRSIDQSITDRMTVKRKTQDGWETGKPESMRVRAFGEQ